MEREWESEAEILNRYTFILRGVHIGYGLVTLFHICVHVLCYMYGIRRLPIYNILMERKRVHWTQQQQTKPNHSSTPLLCRIQLSQILFSDDRWYLMRVVVNGRNISYIFEDLLQFNTLLYMFYFLHIYFLKLNDRKKNIRDRSVFFGNKGVVFPRKI